MGKTKTALISGTVDEKKSSQDAYREKKERQKKEAELKLHVPGLKGGQKVKVMESEVPVEETKEEVKEVKAEKTEKKKETVVKVRGKKYQEKKAQVIVTKLYPLTEAVDLAKTTSYSSFDGTIELHLVVKKAGLTSQVTLPHSFGKVKKVEIASDETIEKLKTGKVDFDILVATPDMMPKLVAFAKILGPKGLMPNPKKGTLISDPKKLKSFSATATTIKTEKDAPLVHTTIGKVSMETKMIVANAELIMKSFGPKQVVKAYTKASMGPSVKISV